jgi:hypothetical protein
MGLKYIFGKKYNMAMVFEASLWASISVIKGFLLGVWEYKN